jgi:hypothetical protein
MMTYALGRELDFTDRQAVEAILAATRDNNYGVRGIVHAIVQSRPFQTR